jgi:hypothetical protein
MRDFLVSESPKRLSQVPESDGLWVTQLYRPVGRASRRELPLLSEASAVDEVLIADARASLRPAQLVERKLMSQLKSVYLPMSHVRTTALCKGRGQFSVSSSQAKHTTGVSTRGRSRTAESEPESQAMVPLCCPS